MTFNQILNLACVSARAHAPKILEDEQLIGAQHGIASAATADSYEHLAQLLVDSRQGEVNRMSVDEYSKQRSSTLYIEFIYDVVTVALLLQDRPISASAITAYARMVGGNREQQTI